LVWIASVGTCATKTIATVEVSASTTKIAVQNQEDSGEGK